jgi:hypothetical protein
MRPVARGFASHTDAYARKPSAVRGVGITADGQLLHRLHEIGRIVCRSPHAQHGLSPRSHCRDASPQIGDIGNVAAVDTNDDVAEGRPASAAGAPAMTPRIKAPLALSSPRLSAKGISSEPISNPSHPFCTACGWPDTARPQRVRSMYALRAAMVERQLEQPSLRLMCACAGGGGPLRPRHHGWQGNAAQ